MSGEGATSRAILDASPAAVATVLADPRAYDGVVVGSRRIRWFDPRWPEPGSRFHHTVGAGPLTIRDHSEVVECDLPHRLTLVVNARPLGRAEVDFRLAADTGGGTRVEMTETPISGPIATLWSPPLALLTRRRNDVTLRRLGELARSRADVAALHGGLDARAGGGHPASG